MYLHKKKYRRTVGLPDILGKQNYSLKHLTIHKCTKKCRLIQKKLFNSKKKLYLYRYSIYYNTI